MIKEIFTKSFE